MLHAVIAIPVAAPQFGLGIDSGLGGFPGIGVSIGTDPLAAAGLAPGLGPGLGGYNVGGFGAGGLNPGNVAAAQAGAAQTIGVTGLSNK